MKKIICLLIINFLFIGITTINVSSFVYLQNTTSKGQEWAVTFGGSNIDVGYYVQQTSDSGYVITGYTRSYGPAGRNIWLVKTDASGNELWNKTFGGANDEEGKCVQQTIDGGYIITGYTKSYGAGGEDLWVIKTDSNGNEVWNKIFGGTADDGGTSVRQTSDGGFIIAGYTSSSGAGSVDAWLIKLDAAGNTMWTKTLGGALTDGAYCVQHTVDDGFILAGWTMSYGPGSLLNAWLVKTDSQGNQQWNKAFGGTNSDIAYCVQQTNDDGFILAGETNSFGAGLVDMYLIKTDSSGNEQWSKTFGGTGRDYCYSVKQTLSGGYILAGYTLSYGAGGDDVWVVKTDSMGNKVWDETFGGVYSDVGYCVQQTSEGGYIVVGHTLSYGSGVHDVWLIKILADEAPPLVVDAQGPYEGFVGEPISFTCSVTGGVPPYFYLWDFGDGNTSTLESPIHAYMVAGNYTISLTVNDNNGNYASDTTWANIQDLNNPPNTPEISGPLSGKPRVELQYTFYTTDSELDDVFYFVDWGDLTNTSWVGPYSSGEQITLNHTWNKKGSYIIKCKAKDVKEAESTWATFEITIPRASLKNRVFLKLTNILQIIKFLFNF
ncbi:MAG: PKD domain-containing protein [Candidatus Thermoplasmatota archaeon]|nr:PKD domain-containing protein [Candidatus Thermoplasmatota archaeon]